MSTPFDFQAMANATDHRDADLLEMLGRLTDLRDQLDRARRRGSTAYNRVLGSSCREWIALDAKVAATTACTSEGRRAKALYALQGANPDPDLPSGGFTGLNAVVLSALYDIVQAGAL